MSAGMSVMYGVAMPPIGPLPLDEIEPWRPRPSPFGPTIPSPGMSLVPCSSCGSPVYAFKACPHCAALARIGELEAEVKRMRRSSRRKVKR